MQVGSGLGDLLLALSVGVVNNLDPTTAGRDDEQHGSGSRQVVLGLVRLRGGGIPPSLRLVDAIAAMMGPRGRDRPARDSFLCLFCFFCFVFVSETLFLRKLSDVRAERDRLEKKGG